MKHSKISDFCYFAFKAYIRYVHEMIFVRHRYIVGQENLPTKDDRYFIVSNHQNTANDPLNILFSLPFNVRMNAMARANAFEVNPKISAFLLWMGVLPAFRLGWEGEGTVEQNFQSFDKVAECVNSHFPVVIFPEAGHTQGHYLMRFTTGTVRMAFHAAKANGWQHDVKILPVAHHYADYFGLRSDFMLTMCKPISLQPYYERFQTHPNSVMRELTREIRSAVHSVMLDEGEMDYAEVDFLRCSSMNPQHQTAQTLPERCKSDQQFVDRLRANSQYADIVSQARVLRQKEESLGIDEQTVSAKPSWMATIARLLLLIPLLPVWVFSLWPNGLCYWLPTLLLKSDRMFTNSFRFVLTVVVLYPLFALLTLLTMGVAWGYWWQALVWILLWTPMARFGWWYYQFARRQIRGIRCLSHSETLREIESLREKIKKML